MSQVGCWLAAALALCGAAACTNGPSPPNGGGFDCDRPVAQLQAPAGVIRVAEPTGDFIIVYRAQAPTARLVGARALRHINAIVASLTPQEADALAADPDVLFVQENGIKRVLDVVPPSWGLDRVDQRALPLDSTFAPFADGVGVAAYIIDTGITPHPDFAGRLGAGFASDGGSTADDLGHGTHVAGTVGGATFGVAPPVTLYPVKVLTEGVGTDADVIAGIEWTTAHAGETPSLAVANMSLGGGAAPALDLAVCRSIAAGVAYAVAAGNEGADACRSSPARVLQALTVGATTIGDSGAAFTNHGPCVTLFAPGVDIVSAQRGGDSVAMSGTSMAAPHVAGALALCARHGAPDLEACVRNRSTPDALTGIGGGSPNRLLYVGP